MYQVQIRQISDLLTQIRKGDKEKNLAKAISSTVETMMDKDNERTFKTWTYLIFLAKQILPSGNINGNSLRLFPKFKKYFLHHLKEQMSAEITTQLHEELDKIAKTHLDHEDALDIIYYKLMKLKRKKEISEWKSRRLKTKFFNKISHYNKQLAKQKWDLKMLSQDLKHELVSLTAKSKALAAEQRESDDDHVWHRTIHTFFVEQILNMQTTIDADDNDLRRIQALEEKDEENTGGNFAILVNGGAGDNNRGNDGDDKDEKGSQSDEKGESSKSESDHKGAGNVGDSMTPMTVLEAVEDICELKYTENASILALLKQGVLNVLEQCPE